MDAYDERNLVIWPKSSDGTPRLKYYLDDNKNIPLSDFWDDIDVISSMGKEALGYQTQKPQALLERIISASSNPGDVVLDPFCGCGTTIHAAQKLGRQTPAGLNLLRAWARDGRGGVDRRRVCRRQEG